MQFKPHCKKTILVEKNNGFHCSKIQFIVFNFGNFKIINLLALKAIKINCQQYKKMLRYLHMSYKRIFDEMETLISIIQVFQ